MTRDGSAGLRRPESASGSRAACLPKLVDERVVLAREHVVIEAHPDASSCRGTPPPPGPPIADSSDRMPAERADSPAARRRRAVGDGSSSKCAVSLGSRFTRLRERRRSRRSARRPTRRCCCCGTSWARAQVLRLPSCVNLRRLADSARRTICRCGLRGGSRAAVTCSASEPPQPTSCTRRALWPSSRCENQSCVMNWIQNAASTLKNGAFL